MSDSTNVFDYHALVAALDEDLAAQLEILSMNPESYHNVQRYLASDLQSLRFNMIADTRALSDTWRPIRDDDAVVDLILDLTTSVRFHVDTLHDQGWAALCLLVSNAMGCFNHAKVESLNCALDDSAERERFVTETAAAVLLQSNPWVVTLFLLRRTETVRTLVKTMADRYARQSKAAATAQES